MSSNNRAIDQVDSEYDEENLEIKTLQDLDDVIKKLKDIQGRLKKVVGEVPGER